MQLRSFAVALLPAVASGLHGRTTEMQICDVHKYD